MTDVAEDGCLSKIAILKMIIRIEKNFAKESCPIEMNSTIILQEMANKRAQRKYHSLIQKRDSDKDKANAENKQESDEDFIDFTEFLEALKKRPELYKTFLPDNQEMIKVLVINKLAVFIVNYLTEETHQC